MGKIFKKLKSFWAAISHLDTLSSLLITFGPTSYFWGQVVVLIAWLQDFRWYESILLGLATFALVLFIYRLIQFDPSIANDESKMPFEKNIEPGINSNEIAYSPVRNEPDNAKVQAILKFYDYLKNDREPFCERYEVISRKWKEIILKNGVRSCIEQLNNVQKECGGESEAFYKYIETKRIYPEVYTLYENLCTATNEFVAQKNNFWERLSKIPETIDEKSLDLIMDESGPAFSKAVGSFLTKIRRLQDKAIELRTSEIGG